MTEEIGTAFEETIGSIEAAGETIASLIEKAIDKIDGEADDISDARL